MGTECKRFQTKKELLRYLWKNEDDRKLVDRMVARGEVRLEWGVYVFEGDSVALNRGVQVSEISSISSNSSDLASDLEYLNNEYEKLEGLLDYALRKCYGIMKKRGIVGSEDTYDDFYERITDGYEWKTNQNGASGSVVQEDLGSVMNKFGIKKASDLI